MNPQSETAPVRPGEELDLARLETFLRERLPEVDGPLTVEQFPHGFSNLTYLLHCGGWSGVLRRPPFGNQVKSAHDMSREYTVLSRLSPHYPPAPRPYLYCEDESVIGAPFYVMERRHGTIIRRGLPFEPATVRGICRSLVDNLAALHALDYQAAGLGELGKPQGYAERQVSGWIKRYRNAQTSEVAEMDRAATYLAENLPGDSAAALVHNDYKYDNLILDPADPTRVIGVLDWEMATLGDPLMDLGTTLGYWAQADDAPDFQATAIVPTARPGNFTRSELVEHYAAASGRDLSNIAYHYVFGLFKIAVIIQQIYARFARGNTQDPRFARLDASVAAIARQAERSIRTGSLSPA